MTTGQNSYNCQEDSCVNPVADSYLSLTDIYSLCQEEAVNMRFLKGHIPWMKGKHHTEESKKKLSESHKGQVPGIKGKHFSEESKRRLSESHKGQKAWNKGIPLTEETKRKLSESLRGRSSWSKGKKFSEEHRKKLSEAHKGRTCPMEGKHHTEEAKKKNSIAHTGERSSCWRGGISFEPYCSKFNKQLKERIRERDNRTCQYPGCGVKENGQRLSVHHIHYDRENCAPDLITLCGSCNGKVNNNRDYWEEYFMNILKERGLVS